jgi:hypothetical protein
MVASSSDVDKSETIVQLAEDLTVFVRKAVADGLSLDSLERGVFKRVLVIGNSAVDFFLDSQGNGDLGDSVTTAEGTVLYRSDTVKTRSQTDSSCLPRAAVALRSDQLRQLPHAGMALGSPPQGWFRPPVCPPYSCVRLLSRPFASVDETEARAGPGGLQAPGAGRGELA